MKSHGLLVAGVLFLMLSLSIGKAQTLMTYTLRTDREILPEPPLPVIGPAGSSYIDPVFGTRITRITDEAFNQSIGVPLNRSWMAGSGGEQNTWAKDGSAFLFQGYGGEWVPFAWNNGKPVKIPTPNWHGLNVQGPCFSFNDPDIVYGHDGMSLRRYSLSQQKSTIITFLPSMATGEVSPSANERLATYGNGGQDLGTHVYVWDGAELHVLDTVSGKVDGVTIMSPGMTWGFGVHNVRLDKSGRFAVITAAGVGLVVWDIDNNAAIALQTAAGGHKASGFGRLVNQDVIPGTPWDDMQYIIRPLDGSAPPANLIIPLLPPRTLAGNGQDSHLSWNNDQSGLEPVLVSAYLQSPEPWRAWSNEIFLLSTDGSGIVYRVCHHRSTVEHFWDGPHAVISPDGSKAIFTSNMGKTLGIGEDGEARRDVFVVELTSAAPAPDPTPTPTPSPTPTPTPTPAPSPSPSPIPVIRSISWPKQQSKQNVILAVQWAERFKLNKSSGGVAEFEKVP